jgi:hypothetical protein
VRTRVRLEARDDRNDDDMATEIAEDGSMKLRVEWTQTVTKWERQLINIHLNKEPGVPIQVPSPPPVADAQGVREFFKRYGHETGLRVLAALDEIWRDKLLLVVVEEEGGLRDAG